MATPTWLDSARPGPARSDVPSRIGAAAGTTLATTQAASTQAATARAAGTLIATAEITTGWFAELLIATGSATPAGWAAG